MLGLPVAPERRRSHGFWPRPERFEPALNKPRAGQYPLSHRDGRGLHERFHGFEEPENRVDLAAQPIGLKRLGGQFSQPAPQTRAALRTGQHRHRQRGARFRFKGHLRLLKHPVHPMGDEDGPAGLRGKPGR